MLASWVTRLIVKVELTLSFASVTILDTISWAVGRVIDRVVGRSVGRAIGRAIGRSIGKVELTFYLYQ